MARPPASIFDAALISASRLCERFEIVWGTADPEGAERSRGPAARRARKKPRSSARYQRQKMIRATEESPPSGWREGPFAEIEELRWYLSSPRLPGKTTERRC